MDLTDLTNRADVGTYLNENGLIGRGIEVGVAYGENAKDILDKWHGEKLYLVDPYQEWEPDEYIDGSRVTPWEPCLEYAKKHLHDHLDRIEWIRKTSDDALSVLTGQFDFIYLDGNHHNPQFRRDLDNYWPLVCPGGLFGGHDFYNLDEPSYRCEVEAEVGRFVAENGLALHVTPECSSWWIRKPL